jgi:steroid 5-alpha reductase family enzyme
VGELHTGFIPTSKVSAVIQHKNMNHKDDTEFLNAFQNAEKRDALLESLLSMRRLQKIAALLFLTLIALSFVLQLTTGKEKSIQNSMLFCMMVNFFFVIHSDMKIKMLLAQKQAEQVGRNSLLATEPDL